MPEALAKGYVPELTPSKSVTPPKSNLYRKSAYVALCRESDGTFLRFLCPSMIHPPNRPSHVFCGPGRFLDRDGIDDVIALLFASRSEVFASFRANPLLELELLASLPSLSGLGLGTLRLVKAIRSRRSNHLAMSYSLVMLAFSMWRLFIFARLFTSAFVVRSELIFVQSSEWLQNAHIIQVSSLGG
jgi:hypothetical protein